MEFHERIIAVMDCPLPQTPKAVLLALARYANAAGEARPGMTTLARCASVSRESVRLAVQYLLDLDGVLTPTGLASVSVDGSSTSSASPRRLRSGTLVP